MKVKIFEFNPFGENTFILFDEDSREAAVVDPGMMEPREFKEFDEFISGNRLRIKYLINTHVHVDHVAGDEYVESKFGIGLSASPLDAFLAQRVAEQARMFHLNVEVPATLRIANELKDGDVLNLGKESIEVISVPGHSPGSVALYCEESGLVIVGDALFRGSIGRTDLPGGDYGTLIKSITSKLLSLPEETVVYPGHGPSTTIGYEKKFNPYL